MKLGWGRWLILVAVLASVSVCLGQVAPDVEQGMKSYGSYHGGAIDQVSLNNQNLFLHASLAAYSQRGGELAYPVVLQYNNKSFGVYQPPPCPPSTPHCPLRMTIVFNPTPFVSNSTSHGNSVTVGFAGVPGVGGSNINTGLSFNGNPIYVSSSSVVMPDGSTHQLVTTDHGMGVTDGSGFWSTGALSAVDSNGTLSSSVPASASAEDRNGNQLTSTTDTLGRQLPATPAPTLPPAAPNPSTASLSACPALNYANQPVTFAYTWNLPTVNNGMLPLILCYAGVYVRTNFLGGAHGPNLFDVSQSFPMLQSVVLPDNTYWAFKYDAADPNNTGSIAFGDLLKVTFPTGGSITYTWGMWNACNASTFSRGVQTRTVDANDGTGPHTWTYANGIVTDPAGNDTVHVFTGLGGTCSQYETQTRYYQGSHASGTLLKTVNTDYTFTANPWDPNLISQNGQGPDSVANVLPNRVTTILPNGQTSKVETDYDAGFTYHGPLDGITSNVWVQECNDPDCSGFWGDQTTNPVTNYTGSYGKPIAQREYDWGQGAPGPLLRQTQTTYQWQVNSAYLTANLLNLPATTKVLDAAGHLCAEADYFYDEPGYLTTPNPAITTQHTTAPWTVRGNLTTVTHKLSATPCAANATWTSVSSHTSWYDTGEAQSSTDRLGHTTTHLYDSAYAGAYSTKTCNALSQCVSGTYDFTTGLLASLTNANATQQASGNTPGDASHTTNFNYDNRWRMTSTVAPLDPVLNLHPETDFDYSVLNQVKRSKRQGTSAWITDYAYFDGVGRTKQTRLVDPQGDDFVDTTYDVLGRVSTVSNPHRSAASATDGVTQTQYDALGRVTQVTKQDGSISTISYSGNCVTATDEAGKARKSCSDALGRLTNVWEDPSGLNYETDYQYDTLGNLLRVDQKGSAPTDNTTWRTRLFTYNSLSQLLTAYNPESGTITYTYDADGNVLTKTAPAPNQTGTTTVTTTYSYDALHRVTQKTYSDGITPPAYYMFDVPSQWGLTITNVVGRLSEAYNFPGPAGSMAATVYSYDALGRPLLNTQAITGLVGAYTSYAYDVAGNMTSYNTGSVATFTQTFDSAGRLTQVNSNYVDAQHPAVLATIDPSAGYTPAGELKKITLANGLTETAAFNNRLQPCRTEVNSSGTALAGCNDAVPSGNVQNFAYAYGTSSTNNGNVVSMSASGSENFNRSYGYDALNRLLTLSAPGDTCSGLNWTYDAWGNRTDQNVTGGSCNSSHLAASTQNRAFGGSYQYDAAGNMTNDGFHAYKYDAENRIIQVDNGATATYTYDALGNRVRKDVGSMWTLYAYDLAGNVVSEFANPPTCTAPCWGPGYIYMDGGKLLAEYADGTTYFVNHDHLGSTRLMTRMDKSIKDSMDYLPYGEQIAGNTSTTHKFTGKERDSESNLDYFGARYYSNGLGRFVTPDWSATPIPVPYADFSDPQSLNQYTYVRNIPTTRVDADGHCPQCVVILVEIYEALTVGEVAAAAGTGAALGTSTGLATKYPSLSQPVMEPGAYSFGRYLSADKDSTPIPNQKQSKSATNDAPADPKRPGTLGKPDHQQTADEEAAKMGGDREVRVQTPGGEKESRVIDAAKVKDGKVTEATQVIRPNKNGTPPAREVRAANDIQKATGVKPKLVPVRPLPQKTN